MINGNLLVNVIIGIIALTALIIAAEQTVKRILAILHHYGLSATFGGLTIFSITTSFPEIISHVVASAGILRGTLDYKIASATVLGANIGSDVVQQTLIVGIVILLMGGIKLKKDFLKTAYLPMIITTLMTLVLAWDRTLSRIDGMILIGTFFGYMYYLYKQENNKNHTTHPEVKIVRDVTISIIGFTIMLVSAHFLLKITEQIVNLTGLGGSLIGVVTLGIASATPELFTAISGLKQKSAGLSLGTLIGSNIVNPLLAIGGGAIISTYWVPRPLIHLDLPMETITAAMLLLYLIKTKGKLGKKGAMGLIGLYFFYILIRVSYFAID